MILRIASSYIVLLAVLFAFVPALAQESNGGSNGIFYDPEAPQDNESDQAAAEPEEAAPVVQEVLNPDLMPSLLFTYWEQAAIRDAKRSRGLVRPPTDEEIQQSLNQVPMQERMRPPPEERDITLGGIVYVSGDEWTIWLNGQKVTPKAIPEEVMDLKVYKNYVELKWFDYYTNRIFPIRLRPHQRFNIDTRIFLPG